MTTRPLEPAIYRELVRRALEEDVGAGDVTSAAVVPAAARAAGWIVANASCVVAGLGIVAEVFHQLDPDIVVAPRRADGDGCTAGDVVVDLSGGGRVLLTGERTALNFLQRLSGIATLTRAFVAVAGAVTVLDTRKTTPTLRQLEKYAVRVGGGRNHRFALDDGVLIKDNHIVLAGGVEPAVRSMRAANGARPIQVEVESLTQADAALAAGTDRLLVDNMADSDVREVVRRSRGRATVEVSGGVSLERMAGIATTGADFVSIGALTHSAPAVDFGLELERREP
ncbi:MAG: carboxylating nicotinate-nucleotide diphosphorylase [Vicinamibacterales bacterium]|nr:carboxylating nicotinate-nucleotide diphosphorylase [Vicinamibacterales bacterium]MDP7473240.1 carboxylating nicotinate-nucleotide diphosphorylase [Vicinamibacterales bacterium]MDP7671267.1 carboxylating nicotinate-nucleotide diphosphorylase [Vicinamibacterales bacterium]HJO38833.1 carboxylating nicotinate-nucleotide diphosphorylase [Vicinamibacterales bacterium]